MSKADRLRELKTLRDLQTKLSMGDASKFVDDKVRIDLLRAEAVKLVKELEAARLQGGNHIALFELGKKLSSGLAMPQKPMMDFMVGNICVSMSEDEAHHAINLAVEVLKYFFNLTEEDLK